MMSIQKIAPSVVSLNQEANIGLATVNVDFSLFKVEAPAEFHTLGKELSKERRNAAEIGLSHVTARKLGALFRHRLPQTGHLIRKYGLRASEIASNPQVNPKPATGIHGIFTDHVGIDGTNIWAAATSGPDAIAVHLLACMLARMWSHPEAVAIWAEMVACRKQELGMADETDPHHQHMLQDSTIEVAREQLAHWDSSARAWLSAADEAMELKQTQLMLILNNISLPVNTKPALYHNVLESWTSAMVAADNLLQGMPQSVQSGSILLGISSWHLYPNMLVLEHSRDPVLQNDHLVDTAGILTLGLNNERNATCGVSWSLPLGQLKYYGRPVVTESSLVTKGNRLSTTQLFQVAVGSMTRHWNVQQSTLASFFQILWNVISPVADNYSEGTAYWLKHLADATAPLLEPKSLAGKQASQLVRLGARRSPHFLSKDTGSSLPKAFGLLNIERFASLHRTPEDMVEYLREFAKTISPSLRNRGKLIIRYARGVGDAHSYRYQFEYATALPMQTVSHKRLHDGEEQVVLNPPGHIRWINTLQRDSSGLTIYDSDRSRHFQDRGESTFDLSGIDVAEFESSVKWTARQKTFQSWGFEIPQQEPDASSYFDFDSAKDDFGDDSNPMFDQVSIDLVVIAGDTATVALLLLDEISVDTETQPTVEIHKDLPLEVVSQTVAARPDGISAERVIRHLNEVISMGSGAGILTPLRVLATIASIYRDMDQGTTVSLEVASHTLEDLPWVSPQRQSVLADFKFRPLGLDRASTFAYIAFCETGHLQVPARDLESVMAMALGDSIYLASGLLCDPATSPGPNEIKRIRGNIGKPGVALLVPPTEPMHRTPSLENWHLVNHNAFDGRLDDAFQKSTMHLGFTEYVMPLHVGRHGSRDVEVYFQESVVSIHDGGEWVADLDILGALKMKQEIKRPLVTEHEGYIDGMSALAEDKSVGQLLGYVSLCSHVQRGEVGPADFDLTQDCPVTSVDDWNEILDPPGGLSIVRSLGNWAGRLAATTLCLRLGGMVIVLTDRVCWACIHKKWNQMLGQDVCQPLLPDSLLPGTTGMFLIC